MISLQSLSSNQWYHLSSTE